MATKRKTSSKSKKNVQPKTGLNNVYMQMIIGFALIMLALYMVYIIHKGATIHTSQISSDLGLIGAFLYDWIRKLFGQCEYFAPLLLILIGGRCCFPKLKMNNRMIITFVVIIVCLLAFRHINIDPAIALEKGKEGIGGGIIGAIISLILIRALSKVGAIITLVAIILISLFIGSNGALLRWLHSGLQLIVPTFKQWGLKIKSFFFAPQTENQADTLSIKPDRIEDGEHKSKKKLLSGATNKIKAIGEAAPERKASLKVNDEETPVVAKKEKAPIKNNDFIKNVKEIHEEIIEDNTSNKVEDYITSGKQEKEDKSIALKHENYELPNESLLDNVNKKVQANKHEIEENADTLKQTLKDFGVKGEINSVNVGPTITQYEFKPAPGVRVTKIVNLADDLALSLATSDIRIEAPIPNKSAVGIEVPNTQPRIVKFKEVIASDAFKQSESKLTFVLGKDISGHPMIGDLAKMPHLLIAGATGAGKSVCLNSLILSILYKAKPNEVKFILIDPKKVELSHYNKIPHLLAPVVTDTKKAAATLKWVVKEMERRYDIFARTGSRDLTTYNQRYIKAEALNENNHTYEFLPQIVIIIDELADLMMVSPADVEDSICRLAQLARAAGIHLVIATQRPSVDIITGLIKANIPSRIAFAVSSQIDSRTILDMGGAEKLLGNGDMLYFPRGLAKPVRIQGVYVTDAEIDNVLHHVKKQAEPVFDEEISDGIEALMGGELYEDLDQSLPEQDKLLGDACRFFIENGNASISMLQRHFRIGYTRAARIIDELENLGFVGPYEGSKARKINIGLAEWEEFFGENDNRGEE